ncbi:MAG: hypothetical protein AAFX87_05960 [Bacteroidota bacterium]
MKTGQFYIIALTIFVSSCKLADLRTSSIDPQSLPREPRAVELLEKVIVAHNLQKLKEAETYSFQTRDNWKGLMTLINPMLKDNEWVEVRFRPMSFDGQMQYLETKNKDVIYGIQSFNYYQKDGASEAEFKKKEKMVFAIAAMQYLFELPLRLVEAPILKYAGTKTFEGTTYELVFATWKSTQPNKEHDQYLLFIHPETYQLAFASYTIREMYMPAPKGMYGSIRYEDMVENEDGIKYPSTLYVQINKLKKNKKWAHKMVLKDLTLNGFDKAMLYPNQNLEFLGDDKPTQK